MAEISYSRLDGKGKRISLDTTVSGSIGQIRLIGNGRKLIASLIMSFIFGSLLSLCPTLCEGFGQL